MTAPLAVVVISDERSSQAARYLAELHAARKRGEFGDVSLAIFNRATGAERRFARAQPWVRNLWVLPYTVIYACGNKADEFASIRAETLVQRLANLRQGTPRSLATPLDRSRMDWRSALIGMRDRAD